MGLIYRRNVSRSKVGNFIILIIILLFAAFFMFPLVFMANNAFKPLEEILVFPPPLFVQRPTLNNFVGLSAFFRGGWVPLSRYVFNSVFISFTATGGTLLLSSMAAYPLAKHKFLGKKTMNTLVIMSLLFSVQVLNIPRYIIYASVGMINTQWALILPAWQLTLGLYLLKNFMGQINDSMLEAARIDGCSEFRIYSKIVMPNVRPALLTLLVFSFMGTWNMDGGIFLFREDLRPFSAILAGLANGGIPRLGMTGAATLILMLPPTLLFLFSQNLIVETMSTSGLKD